MIILSQNISDPNKTYRITVKPLKEGSPLLTFSKVKSYISEGGLIHFKDSFNGRNVPKIFAVANCEIEEEEKGGVRL